MVANEPAPQPPAVIRLDHFLKRTGAVATGGQAKRVIQAGEVSVNGVIERRRSHKLQVGDKVQWMNESFEVGGCDTPGLPAE